MTREEFVDVLDVVVAVVLEGSLCKSSVVTTEISSSGKGSDTVMIAMGIGDRCRADGR